MVEQWKDVVGYEGAYQVSDEGGIRSLHRVVPRSNGIPQTIKGRTMKTPLTRAGYPEVRLYPPGGGKYRGKNHLVHRLVLTAFVGPCPEGMEALHDDDVKTNNLLSNLRWGTSSENKYDIVKNGNHGMARKTHCKWSHPLVPANLARGPWERSRRRICQACKLERGNARTAKRPFDIEKSWVRFKELMEAHSG